MKLRTLKLNDNKELHLDGITVLVGPNNVGKSQTLRDIKNILTVSGLGKRVIVKDIDFDWEDNFDKFLEKLNLKDSQQNLEFKIISGLTSNLMNNESVEFSYDTYNRYYMNQEKRKSKVLGNLTRFFVSDLSSSNRLALASSVNSINPETKNPKNILQALFLDKTVEPTIQMAFTDAFRMELALDYSGMTKLCFRVAEKMPDIPADPREAYTITENLEKIEGQGDGFRSFVGIILGLLFSKGRIILLDEPEAFLHPAQARFLGKWIGDNKDLIEGQLIISTHNANFLSGILASGNKVDIYRLNRQGNNTTFTALPADSIKALFENPLLSSQRVVESVFYRGVAVCEADADRAVYQSVATIKHKSNEDVLFIHSQNKQTLHVVSDLLRKANIPVIVIPDIDVLNNENDLKKIVESLNGDIPHEVIELRNKIATQVTGKSDDKALAELTEEIRLFLTQLDNKEHDLGGAKGALNRIQKSISDWKEIKLKGIEGFDDSIKGDAFRLVDILKGLGVFIVPVGELEGWIELGTRKKNKWIVPALEQIHSGNAPKSLVKFVGEILCYFDR